jgi:multiple antibiotic resistance protein
VTGITYATLRVAERIVLVIGINGMNALSKVMGFLILCIGVQFVVNGVLAIVTDPELIHSIRAATATAAP